MPYNFPDPTKDQLMPQPCESPSTSNPLTMRSQFGTICRKFSCTSYFPAHQEGRSRVQHHIPQSNLSKSENGPTSAVNTALLNLMNSFVNNAGAPRDPRCVQTLSPGEDSDIRDRSRTERGVPGDPWDG